MWAWLVSVMQNVGAQGGRGWAGSRGMGLAPITAHWETMRLIYAALMELWASPQPLCSVLCNRRLGVTPVSVDTTGLPNGNISRRLKRWEERGAELDPPALIGGMAGVGVR